MLKHSYLFLLAVMALPSLSVGQEGGAGGAKEGSKKYEEEGIQEVNAQLKEAMEAFGARLVRSVEAASDVGHRFINESKHWLEFPPIITHNFTNAFNNILPLRSPLMDLMYVLTILICLMIIRWIWVAFLECLEGLHVYCFPEPNIIHPDYAPPIIDSCCDQLPCKPIPSCALESPPCSIPIPPTCEVACIDDHCDVSPAEIPCVIEALDYVEDLPCCPIEIETEPETEVIRSEERVEISQPEEIVQSTSLRSSLRSMRTVGVEHSVKMRNSQRTEHFERTVVSN